MREDLNRWLDRSTHVARHTELGTDVVCSGCCVVTQERSLSEIPALLGVVLDKCGGIEIGLWYGDVEDTGSGGDMDWDAYVHAFFGGC